MYLPGRVFSLIVLLLLLSLLIYWGCEKSTTELNDGSLGSLVVKITDDPFPIGLVSKANVTIDKIEIRRADEELGYPFVILYEDTTTINLVDLRNGLTENLVEIEIPVGTYDLIRLYVAAACIVLSDGNEFDLVIPSGAQTGLKIFIHPTITVIGGLTSELILDFDLSKSFEVQGNPNTPAGIKGFHFKPVIRAVNNSTAGRIVGTVVDNSAEVIEEAQVWVEKDTLVSNTYTNAEGSYALIGIPAGIYTVRATKAGYDSVSVTDVKVLAANHTIVNFTLTAP